MKRCEPPIKSTDFTGSESNYEIDYSRAYHEGYDRDFPIMLLAEDNVPLRNLFLRALQPTSLAIPVGADGQEAIDISRFLEDEIVLQMPAGTAGSWLSGSITTSQLISGEYSEI